MDVSGKAKQLFQLKFTSKQFTRMSKKAKKQEAAQRRKLKKAIEDGNTEGARIYAQNAIREKNQSLNYLRMGSRIDAVASRLQSAIQMKRVTKTMAGVTKGMDKALQSMNLEEISAVMDKFEEQFSDMDVTSQFVENAMGDSTQVSAPVEQVDSLIQEVADEHGLEVSEQLGTPSLSQPASTAEADAEDDLTARLAALR
ncbi:charged multivesicular body protein 1 [Thecamonas trahens ATCC 50062]|uniref:Charged multivesicular body protein 1 n=1 Tax=Thecamonas trahens ATCC 50062 TaxID=461836 RepID=A0A0L0DC12_THETB|nr:charged multivesicular body protein 1 [Thecamonas trahens ATCC 50062]KNC49611.1 charged multivesicular body protein 1 [Thecamonas trahens ATCC 50062]|eukprot:XP_013757718.1 charged multivesicular body protein 1 [Thecamonas trahens ATCC 50062]